MNLVKKNHLVPQGKGKFPSHTSQRSLLTGLSNLIEKSSMQAAFIHNSQKEEAEVFIR